MHLSYISPANQAAYRPTQASNCGGWAICAKRLPCGPSPDAVLRFHLIFCVGHLVVEGPFGCCYVIACRIEAASSTFRYSAVRPDVLRGGDCRHAELFLDRSV